MNNDSAGKAHTRSLVHKLITVSRLKINPTEMKDNRSVIPRHCNTKTFLHK